jgi:hypothetical protein
MSNILGKALGEIYNNAPGISTKDGVITEWPDSLGPIPSVSAQAQIIEDAGVRLAVKKAISDLEALITPRRAREHMLGTGGSFIADIEAKIELERAKL